jgi:hypothetical protein
MVDGEDRGAWGCGRSFAIFLGWGYGVSLALSARFSIASSSAYIIRYECIMITTESTLRAHFTALHVYMSLLSNKSI